MEPGTRSLLLGDWSSGARDAELKARLAKPSRLGIRASTSERRAPGSERGAAFARLSVLRARPSEHRVRPAPL